MSEATLEVAQSLEQMGCYGSMEQRVLEGMRCQRLEVYAFHRNAAAACCTRRFQWQRALELLGRTLKRRNMSAAVNALKQAGRWHSAFGLLASFSDRKIEADASGCNALASALERFESKSWQQLLSWLQGLPRLDEDMTFHSLLRVSSWSLSLAVWRSLSQAASKATDFSDCIGLNALMSPLARAGRWQYALGVFQLFKALGVRCDGASYSTAMDASKDSWSSALELLLRMKFHTLAPCRFQYTAVCDVCTAAENWERALDVFDLSKALDTWDVLLGTSGLAALSKSSKWMSAMWTFATLPQVSLQPNTITSTSALSACERGRQWQMALLSMNEMLEKRLVNELSFSSTMHACEKFGQWKLLGCLLATMTVPWSSKEQLLSFRWPKDTLLVLPPFPSFSPCWLLSATFHTFLDKRHWYRQASLWSA